jgi:hypothetical protein
VPWAASWVHRLPHPCASGGSGAWLHLWIQHQSGSFERLPIPLHELLWPHVVVALKHARVGVAGDVADLVGTQVWGATLILSGRTTTMMAGGEESKAA